MKQYEETLREIVDECVSTPNCKTCPFARDDGKYCIIGYPVTWQLSEDMEAEGYWDPEGEEAWDDVEE